MNIMFWGLLILMLLVAIGLLVYPLLKARKVSALAYKDSNLKINDEKIQELDVDLAEDRIDQQFYKAAREELDRELLIDIPAESKETAADYYASAAKRHPALALIISVFVPMLALLLYLDLGMHNASEESFAANQASITEPAEAQLSVEKMTQQLEAKIEKDGGTTEEWIMLGRAHKHMGNNTQAAKAFAVALEQDANNAQLMLERAEVLALSNDRKFADEARALVLKAQALEPDNANALWFAGVAEYQYGNYHKAIAHLTKLLPFAAGEEDVMKSIVSIVAKSRQALIDSGEEMPELAEILGIEAMLAEAKAKSETKSEITEPVSTARLLVSIDVSEQVKQKFNANDTVFVYAKARQGPRMPLAAQRITLADLPAVVVLDDSMAMAEGMNLSAFDELVISARVSKTGSAIAQSGDFIGQLPVKGEKTNLKLNIVIDTAVP
ncbi:Cytochrome c heme lyase subunit CcmH [hydrothermal vent metagenome]|uniref:Cytochrome c heme lyase subunit CcmH n=1 Tax=hydrothermal vent metagenome TaxID=652676 RepID=A0A3B0WFV3_9ZZZZ